MLTEEILLPVLEKYSNLGENNEISRMIITTEVSKFIHENYIDTNKLYDYKVQCTEENNEPNEKEHINVNIFYQERKHMQINLISVKIRILKAQRRLKLEQIQKRNEEI